MVLAAALVTLAYVVPVTFGVALQPNTALWVDGFLVTVARDVAPWLAALVVLSAILSNLSSLLSGLAAYSRTLQAVARQGFLPVPLLARNQTRFETPVAAICVLALSTLALTYGLHFSALVIADSCFYTVSQVRAGPGAEGAPAVAPAAHLPRHYTMQASVIFAFIRLKYSDTDLPRPYLFPGGMAGAWAAVAVSVVLVVVALVASLMGGGESHADGSGRQACVPTSLPCCFCRPRPRGPRPRVARRARARVLRVVARAVLLARRTGPPRRVGALR